jgi:hypothetical protein
MRRAAFLSIIPCILSFGGCISGRPIESASGSMGEPRMLGSFALESGRLGHVTVAPNTCTAGDRQFFLGADFEDEKAGVVVRLVVDPLDGPAARVFASAAPFEKAAVFRRPECRVFLFSLDTTGWRINRIQDYRLTLELDCANTEGDSIIGKASVAHCH